VALNAFLNFEGKIKGSARQKGREGKVTVIGFQHRIGAIPDSNGFPTKENTPGAVIVTKEFDLASPKLHEALQNGTKFGDVKIEFWRMPPTGGQEENYYTIVLSDAQIASIQSAMLLNKIQENSLIPEHEQVAISYKGISFTFKSAEGASNSGPFMRDKFDDYNDALGAAIKSSIASSAADIGKGIAQQLKSALSELKGGGGGTPAGGGF
jgi:type VI secretion system Hcp family effector